MPERQTIEHTGVRGLASSVRRVAEVLNGALQHRTKSVRAKPQPHDQLAAIMQNISPIKRAKQLLRAKKTNRSLTGIGLAGLIGAR